jgi:Zn-dependent peptidase ImmA (M78 family)
MSRFQYYQQAKALARKVRATHGLVSVRIRLSDIRRIYSAYGIRIDMWPYKLKDLRGAYFNDEAGTSVMVAKNLPEEPRIFTLCHELKHHLMDSDIQSSFCDRSNESEQREIGAEIFAAEFIFPEDDFVDYMSQMGIRQYACTPETLVRFKYLTQTTMSYSALAKRTEFLKYAPPGSLAKIKWKKLYESIYGEPIYKRIQRMKRLS